MIRPFHLRDLTLVHRLGERGMVLQTQSALTSIPRPVRHALIHILVGGRKPTFVWKSDGKDAAGYAQLCWGDGDASAYIANIGLELSTGHQKGEEELFEDRYLKLLDELVKETGRIGIHHLVAEAPENGYEMALLRKAGFAIYTRQDIWVAHEAAGGSRSVLLVPKRSVDDWDINILYSNSLPGLIHSVEPSPPLLTGENLILREEDGELAAYVHIVTGSVGSWIQFFIHPNARTKPKEIISAALDLVEPMPELPVYCCVRRYQSWLQNALERSGLTLWGSQAVLVKQLVQPIRQDKHALQEMIQAQTVPGSSPAVQGFSPDYGQETYKSN